jgi:AAA+ ATPase superfamily predicted ATPase
MKKYIDRTIQDLHQHLQPWKVVIILGPKRSGKTTLVNHFLENTTYKFRVETGDNIRINELIETGDLTVLRGFAQNHMQICNYNSCHNKDGVCDDYYEPKI